MWNARAGVFTDYSGRRGVERRLDRGDDAPLALATPAQAHAVADTVRARLLAPGGLATTLIDTGQQWDAATAGRRCNIWRSRG